MAKACCVCGDAADKQDNLLFTCKGHGCDVVVHQACYGIVNLPGGQWFCRKCESQERAARVRCELCPKKEGALKRTDSGGWAHVVCALYIPEVTFLNNTKMEPIITSKLPRERFSKACYICEQKGQESQATYGACMSCHKSSCRMAFHVTCAQKERLLCEEEDTRDSGSLVYCGYCSGHYKKMIQKKHKQNLRKHAATPTLTVAPPLPTITTLTASQSSPLTPHSSTSFPAFPSSPPHKDLPDPLPPPSGDHLGGQKGHQTGNTSHGNQSHRARNRDKERKEGPQKRISADAPIPPAKRKNRRRKLSSSNESSTSEAPSNASDFIHASGHQPLEQANANAALREGREGRGLERVAAMRKRESEILTAVPTYSKRDGSRIGSHSVSPVPALETDRGKESAASRVGGPPLSLQDLLERQWQQTAQYILDQAGRQNNAGVMLAHLHELQSENRTMQSRIMELASQREFYIAINTRLRQTLADGTPTQLPNGLQPSGSSSDGLVQSTGHALATVQQPPSSPNFHRSASSERVSPSPSLPAPSSAGSLSRQDQESLLQAHFLASSLPAGYQPPLASKPQQATPTNAHHPVRNIENPGFKQEVLIGRSQSPSLGPYEHTATYSTTAQTERLSEGERHGGRIYEVTHVTNAVQAPLSSYGSVPESEIDSLSEELPQSGQQN